MSLFTDLRERAAKHAEQMAPKVSERQAARHERIEKEMQGMELSSSYDPESVKKFEEYINYLEDIATKPYSKKHAPRELTAEQEDHLDSLVEQAINEKNPAWVALRDYQGTESQPGTPKRWAQQAANGYWNEIHPDAKIKFCPDPTQELTSAHPGTGRIRHRMERFDPKDPAIAFKMSLGEDKVLLSLKDAETYYVENDLLPKGKMNFSMNRQSGTMDSLKSIYERCPEKLVAAARLYVPRVKGDPIRDTSVLKAVAECKDEAKIQKYVEEFKEARTPDFSKAVSSIETETSTVSLTDDDLKNISSESTNMDL